MILSNSLRKKGGIFIKKIKFFLILIFSIFFINNLSINAESANFYEGEYIDGIYMNKYQYSTKTIYYQKARFFRKTGTNEFAYCIEPFRFFNENSYYESTLTPSNLSIEQIDRISKIAYFGYGYGNHTDPKWYAITQLMIWQASDSGGDYYFTDGLNGKRVNYYSNEISEINYLINEYNKLPSLVNKNFTIVEDHDLVINDENNVLKYFQSNNDKISLTNNSIKIKDLTEGEYNFLLTKKAKNFNKPLIFYQSGESQNLIKTGDLNDINCSFKVKVLKTSLTVTKIDKDTMSIIPSGEANLNGAIFTLYNSNMNELMDFEIINNQFTTKNLPLGKYYIKEKIPGTGYIINDKIYEINIDENKKDSEIIVENEVIKKKITINKKYGENDNFHNEKNIEFDVYDKNHNLIKTISTNDNGIVEITLPFGEYTFIQKNTTTGYNKLEPFKIQVENNENELIELKDYKIPVPNTSTNFYKNLIYFFLKVMIIVLC